MKYDLVIGNPPYQSINEGERNIGAPLWPQFIAKGMDMLVDGGTLAYVMPATWMNRAPGGAWKHIKKYDLEYVNPNVHEYFPGVDVPNGISVIRLRKQDYSGVTSVSDEFEINFHEDDFPINTKLLTPENMLKFKRLMERKLDVEVFSGPNNPSINGDQYSEKKTRQHKYETYYSGHIDRRSIWCDEPVGHHGELKLVVACSGAFYKTMEITTKGVGRQGNYILGDSVRQLNRIKKLLLSDDSKTLCELMMYGRFNNALEYICNEV